MMAWFSAQAAVFDLDDTLLDWTGAQRQGLEVAFDAHLGHRPRDEVHAAFEKVLDENFAAVRRTGRWWYPRDRFGRLLEILDEPREDDALAQTFSATVERRLDLLPGAVEALDAARDHGLQVGLLTNGPVPFQRDKFDRLEIADRFDHIAISGETGHWKPAPEAFHGVFEALGVRPRDAVMVGDSPEHDLRPAAALGMRTVHIHPHEGCADADMCAPHPHAMLERLGQPDAPDR